MDLTDIDPISRSVQQLHKNHIDISQTNTFELFDALTFGQLEKIYENFWSIFSVNFQQKPYRGHILPVIIKNDFKRKLQYIRLARNEVSHHQPINYSRRSRSNLLKDIELILRHLDYNVEDAINGIDPTHTTITLQYI